MKYPRHLASAVLVSLVLVLSACRRPVPTQPPTPVQAMDPIHTVTPFPSPTIVATATRVASPSPAFHGSYVGTPTPNPTPVGFVRRTGVESYEVRSGQTLSWIAAAFGVTVDELVAANNLPDANSISAGQTIVIPVTASQEGPTLKLVPDSEMVYGPAYIHFDLAQFVDDSGGFLAEYGEVVEGRSLSGVEIVELVSQRFSVGPRVLLTLVELGSGWVTQPQSEVYTLAFPAGYAQDNYKGLFWQLSWAAARLNEGYYGWKSGNRTTMRLADGTRVAFAPGLNPGTAGIQNCLAELSNSWDDWMEAVGPNGFLATYQALFGNPFAYEVEPLMPAGLQQPELKLPWQAGLTWYLTSGPHGGWANDDSLAALDFAPSEEYLGCEPSAEWAAAAAPGLVVRSGDGQVVLDLDGDGFEQSGWVLLYMHMYSEGRAEVGTYLQQGDPVGHPSCEGGVSEASHLHFARRYNGEWVRAGAGPLPMVLSGWTAQDGGESYDGTMVRGTAERTACECYDDQVNGLYSDNAP